MSAKKKNRNPVKKTAEPKRAEPGNEPKRIEQRAAEQHAAQITEQQRRRKWHERTAEKDIRYRGPLNYQHFQILGWLCIVAGQFTLILQLAARFGMLPDQYAALEFPARIMSWLALPFLLIANFAQIMNGQKTYRFLLVKNFAAAAAIWAVYAFALNRYVIGTVDLINDGTVASADVVTRFMVLITSSGVLNIGSPGILAFNIFIDLFLCTLVMFFLNYKPKKIFAGKSRFIFRAFALLPIAYEAGCIVLKVMASRNEITVSPYLYPLFTVKPTTTFVLFIVLVFYIKTREWRFCRHGKSHEEYAAFLHTKKNSWDFSLFLSVALVVFSVLDYVILLRVSNLEYIRMGEAAVTGSGYTPVAFVMGFGDSIMLWIIAPLVLLFSYTQKPRNPMLGTFVPAASFGLILLLYVEAGHQALPAVNLPKINLQGFVTGEVTEEQLLGEGLLQIVAGDLLQESTPAEESPAQEPGPESAPAAENPAETVPVEEDNP